MKLGINTNFADKTISLADRVQLLIDAGFDAIDMSMFHLNDPTFELAKDDYKTYCRELRARTEAQGVIFHQAHAPFGGAIDVYRKNCLPLFPRAFACAALLGVEVMVIHPVQTGRFYGHEKERLDDSIAFYRELLPMAKEYGVKIGIENMWQVDARGYIVDDSLESPEHFCACYDMLDDPYIVGCLDLGHVAICGRDPQDMIRALGHDRLGALHVHDTDLIHDLHTLPYMGKQNWNEICRALGEIGYEGVFTYEAECFLRPYDDDFLPTALRFMHDTGRMLIQKTGL